MMKAIVLLTLGLLSSTLATYEGFKVYKFVSKSVQQNSYLKGLALNSSYDFWSEINNVGNPVSVMVTPDAQATFEAYLKESDTNYSIEIEDVEETVQAEKAYQRALKPLAHGRVSFTQYLSHAEIVAYTQEVARNYPNLVTLGNLGQSNENRAIPYVRISSGQSANKKKVFVDAGIHAREWIAPAMAVYLINQLVENTANRYLLNNIDWIIVPLLNPDGYEYSRNSERLWRKTRSRGSLCYGVDGNRNFDYYWMYAGASSWECSETYAGPRAFSEVEAQHLRDFLLAESNVAAYLTLHSYGNYLLYPWGYANVLPNNWRELQSLGERVAAAIAAVAGTRYTIGSSTQTLYAAAGASDDWAMGGAGIQLVYTIELPGGGSYGFDLPASRILPVAQETFEGFKVYADYIGNLK